MGEYRDPLLTAAYLDMASVTLFYALEKCGDDLDGEDGKWLHDTACRLDDMARRLMEAVE